MSRNRGAAATSGADRTTWPVAPTAIVLVGVLALSACGSDASAPAAADLPSTTPTTERAAAPPAIDDVATTISHHTTTMPTAVDPGLMLRGDGLGIVDFGVPQDEALSAIESVLGPPSAAGPVTPVEAPWMTVGCLARTELVFDFGSLRVGVTDFGSGAVLAAWSAVAGATDDVALATPEGLVAGATPQEASVAYPGSAPPDHTAFAWMRVEAAYGFDTGNGPVLLAGSGPDGAGPWLLTAGSD